MNKNKVKEILDKTNIYVLDEANIIEYIDELEKVKEEYIKSLDKLDVLDNRIDKAIEYIEKNKHLNWYVESCYISDLLKLLKGEE